MHERAIYLYKDVGNMLSNFSIKNEIIRLIQATFFFNYNISLIL